VTRFSDRNILYSSRHHFWIHANSVKVDGVNTTSHGHLFHHLTISVKGVKKQEIHDYTTPIIPISLHLYISFYLKSFPPFSLSRNVDSIYLMATISAAFALAAIPFIFLAGCFANMVCMSEGMFYGPPAPTVDPCHAQVPVGYSRPGYFRSRNTFAPGHGHYH
jgi:hypothetical protein